MSYCVNCGVELGGSERSCPLCRTVVYNPNDKAEHDRDPRYPNVPVSGVKLHSRDLVLPIALLLLIPVIISIVCDFLTSERLSWSLFVASSIALTAVFMLPPLAQTRQRALPCVLADWLATTLFIYFLDLHTPGKWFLPVGLPLCLVSGALVVTIAALFVYVKLEKLVYTAIILFSAGIVTVCFDALVSAYLDTLRVSWSFYVLVPCAVLAVVALLVNRNKRLKEHVKHRFFV